MKFTHLFFIFAFIVLFGGCDDQEIHMLADYEFDLNTTHEKEAIIQKHSQVDFFINQGKSVEGQVFNISYEILKGEGKLFFKDEEIPEGGNFQVYSKTNQFLNYQPLSLDSIHQILLIAENPYNRLDTSMLHFSIAHMDFVITIDAPSDIELNKKYAAAVNIASKDDDGSVRYSAKWFGEDENLNTYCMLTGEKRDTHRSLAQKVYRDSIHFVAKELGKNTLCVEVKDSNGNKKSVDIAVNVAHTDFSYNIETQRTDIPLNTPQPLIQYFSGDQNGELQYQVSYTILKDGELKNVQKISYVSGKNYPLDKGKDSLFYTPIELGEHLIKVRAFDSNGQEILDSIKFNVSHIDYSFDVSLDQELLINKPTELVLFLDSEAKQETDYFVQYNSSKELLLITEAGAVKWQSGQEYKITPGQTKIALTPSTEGKQHIEFFVRDENDNKKTVKKEFNVLHTSFSHSTDVKPTLYINAESVAFLAIATSNEELSYEMAYDVDIEADVFLEGVLLSKNQFQKVTAKKRNNLIIVPKTLTKPNEKAKFITTVVDENGQKIIKEYEFVVVHQDFSFDVTEDNKEIPLNTDALIFLNLNGSSDLTYSLSFSNALKSKIKIGNQQLYEGVSANIPKGQTTLVYSSSELGKETLDFTVTDQNGYSKTKSISFNVANIPFTVALSTPYSEQEQYSTMNVHLNLTGDPNLKYEAVFNADLDGQLVVNNQEWLEGDVLVLEQGKNVLTHKALEVGTQNITINVTDANNQTKSVDLSWNVKQPLFNINVVKTVNSLLVNTVTPVSMVISANESSEVTYKWSYEVLKGEVELLHNGTTLGQHIWLDAKINEIWTQDLKGLAESNATIRVHVENSEGQKEYKDLDIKITHLDYSIAARNGTGTINVNQEANINFTIEQGITKDSNMSYKLKYDTSNGIIYQGNNAILPHVPFSVPIGTSNLRFKPSKEGSHTINFECVDANGLKKTTSVSIGVSTVDFELLAIPTKSNNTIDKSTLINMSINPQSSSSGITYQMRYETSGLGNLVIGGKTVLPGSWVDVNAGAFDVSYIGREKGTHSITFTVRDSYGTTKSVAKSIEINPVDFNWRADLYDDQIFVTQENKINCSLTSADNTMTYKLTPTFNTKGRFYINGTELASGIPTTIPQGRFDITYESTNKEEDVVIDFKIEDENGEKKQSVIEFKVKYPNFEISAYAVKDVVISTPTDIILKVFPEESVPSAEYKLIYTNTGSGKLEVGGSVLNTGGEITISEGDNTLQFTPTNLGSNSLHFEVNDNFGNKKNATITITGVHNDFNVLLTASIKKVGTNAIVKLNYTLDPEKEIPNINYEIALQTEGEISLDQTTWHTTGKKLPVTKETHTIYYRNAIPGDYNVVLKTTDSNGKDKNATTNIEVRDRPVLTEHKVSKWDKKDSMFGNTYHFLELTGFIYSLAKNTSLATLKFRFKRKNNSWTEWEILDWSKNKFRDYPNFIEFNSTNETIRLENHTKEESDFRFNKGAAIEFILVDSEGIESEVKAGTITW